MEERTTGGSSKDKKYVLYTVVGDDRPRASPGALMTRVLLSCLLVVALAVVPYVSLRLAQANNRTLVVFQPVPLHNRSAVRRFHSTTKEVQLMQIADLKLENASLTYENDTSTTVVPIGISTSHISNITEPTAITGLRNDTNFTTTVVKTNLTTLEAETLSKTEAANVSILATTESSASDALTVLTLLSTNTTDATSENQTLVFDNKSMPSSPIPTASTTPATHDNATVITTQIHVSGDISTEINSFSNISTTHMPVTQKVSTEESSEKQFTTSKLTTKPSLPATKEKNSYDLKLAYVATSASGNHVGGICVWKSGNNVTDWSYFYENIPIELQSDHANGDHELRATLAALRTWTPRWQDTHVVLRSSHAAIKESDLPLRQHIVDELESRSTGLFTYELEWRLPQGDPLVKTASSLSHLHQDYKFWFQDFQNLVNDLIGVQEWKIAAREKHVKIDQGAFFDTGDNENENSGETEDLTKATHETIVETETPQEKNKQPPAHKLVYMATSASGNHVGGFCMWKVGRNVTSWSYFYDNVPVELQSSHDAEDHEVRAALAGVRVWADRWDGAHVSLRSQRSPLLRSHTATFFLQTLDVLSTSHFSYDLEWQLRKSDELVRISYSLSRLYRNFGHWFASFKASVDDVVGPQDWNTAAKAKRIHLNDEHFFIDPIFPEVHPSEVTKNE